MKKKYTERGFPYYEFTETYGVRCTLQLSSLAEQRCIWLGVDHPEVLRLGPNGWNKMDLGADVSIPSRMHLSTKQVKKLLPILIKFVETGDI